MGKNQEERFQHEFIMKFGQTWPEYNHMLFEVNNNPKNEIDGANRKSKGMKKSVSDLVFQIPIIGTFCGIELKAPGSVWGKKKITPQLMWGLNTISNGGYFIMTSNRDLLMNFVTALVNQNFEVAKKIQTDAMDSIMIQMGGKTIKF